MASSMYYFGAPPSGSQIVSANVALKGIRLLRCSPSAAYPVVLRHYHVPSYESYCRDFAAAAHSGVTGKNVFTDMTNHYFPLTRKTTPVFMRIPTVVWSYGEAKDASVLAEVRNRYNAIETSSQGKPVLSATLSLPQVATLVRETQPIMTTPASLSTINLDAYKTYLWLHRVADLFLRIHQYPLVTANTMTELKDFHVGRGSVYFEELEHNGEKYVRPKAAHYRQSYFFKTNLPNKDLDAYDYVISNSGQIPNHSGLLVPFVADLAREDSDMVPFVVSTYFWGLLAADRESAEMQFELVKSSWGVLKNTLWGDELAHLYAGIRMAFESGAMIRPFVSPNNLYQGFILCGEGYELSLRGKLWAPAAYAEVQSLYKKANPHIYSLSSFMELVNFDDDIERQAALKEVKSCYDVSLLARTKGYDILSTDRMMKLAQDFCFPGDVYLSATAFNISRVLDAISQGREAEEKFPLHPIAILEIDKTKRLLSAFGTSAPNFKIPNGRSMPLTGSFSYKTMQGKNKVERTTTRVFAQMVPWKEACTMLAEVIKDKTLQSPIGTPLATRNSARSMMREYEGEGGASVLNALRRLVGVSVEGEATAAAGKRKREEDEEKEKSKKAKVSSGFDFD